MAYSTIKEDVLGKWKRSYIGGRAIPSTVYVPKVRIVSDETCRSNYTFGLILKSPDSPKRLIGPKMDEQCIYCETVKSIGIDWRHNLMPEFEIPGFIAVSNDHPWMRGQSIAISSEIGEAERPSYDTRSLNHLAGELHSLLSFGDVSGLGLFHDSRKFFPGESSHEHYSLWDVGVLYDIAGGIYGFDAADKIPIKGKKGVFRIPGFPFAHLVFDKNDPGRLVNFLKRLGEEYGNKCSEGFVPHTLSQGREGILVMPSKELNSREILRGEAAGHIAFLDCEKFETRGFDECFSRLGEVFVRDKDMNLERLV